MPTLKEEKKLWGKGYKWVVGLDEAGRGCEKSDAEVLTDNGWKFYKDINLEDRVLSYTNDGYIKWQKIERVVEKDFKGNLIEFKNRGIHIVVTPEHYFTVIKRVSKRDKKDNNRLKLVGYKTREERRMVTELTSNDFIPRGGKWKGMNKKYFKLPKIDKNREISIDIKLWLAFLGIYLSEGSVSYDKKKGLYRIVISQNENAPQRKYEKIHSLLKKLPLKFSKIKNGFQCYNKQLYTYLKQFGKCYDKFIPKEIKELSPELLNILVKWMILGDGTCYSGKNRKKVCIYYSASKKLKDDFEEVLLKAGWTFHTTIRRLKDNYIKGRLIKKENRVPCFEIRLRRNNKVIVKHLHKKNIFYNGKVFCLQLPEYHNFYIRRNGTGYFTGNSLAGPVVAAAVMIVKNSEPQLKSKSLLRKIKDSKQLTPKKREEFYKILTNHLAIEWGIGIVSEKVIDKINIKNAAELAMKKALDNLNSKTQILNSKQTSNLKLKNSKVFLLIDGNHISNLQLKTCHFQLIVKGDEKVLSCAAASIIAKVTRDKIMKKMDKIYPQYGFQKHKGYGTKLHFEMLKKYGPCKIHRKTFRPIADH